MTTPPSSVQRVRVICLDRRGAVLLMKWHDPVAGRSYWEPPGGGIEEGEEPRGAAVRELAEETGFAVELDDDCLIVARDYHWLGRHFVHDEAFFRARVTRPAAAPALTVEEVSTFVEMRFVVTAEIAALADPLEPPNLVEIVKEMTRGSAR